MAMLMLIVAKAAADDQDYRSKGQENWVRFTFILKDSQTGQPIDGRVYYQSEFAADWFHPDNTQPLLPPGVYRLVGWERNYWQSEQTLVVDPRKGLRQKHVINLHLIAARRDSSTLKVPAILSSLVISGNAREKMPHMNTAWFGKNNSGSFHIWTTAWSEYPGGSGGGTRISNANIEYDFFHDAAAAKKHFDYMRQFFTQRPSPSQSVSGPSPVKLGDEALQISTDTQRPDGGGILYENRRFLICHRNVIVRMQIHREVGVNFLASPEDILERISALDMRQVKRMLEPEPFPWPEIEPPLGAGRDDGDPQTPIATPGTGNEPVSPEKVLLAVAGGSLVMTLGAFLQLFGMGGLQNIRDIRGMLGSLLSSSGADVPGAEPGFPESEAIQEVEVIPKEPEALAAESSVQEPVIPETVIPDPIPPGFKYQGKVWYQPPWDKGGPYWMSQSDYSSMRAMMRQGKVWSDRWGWVDPEEGRAMEVQNAAAWEQYKSDTDADIKTITDQIKESQEKLSEIREKQAGLERIEQMRERLDELERQRELDNSFAVQLQETMWNYVEGVNRDLDALPGDLQRLALEAARGVRDTTGAVITALTDVDNYTAVGQAAVDTAKDLILHPVDSSVRVGEAVKGVASMAKNVAAGIACDPIGFAESVVGIDNWKKVLDPNVPVGERVARALYGAVDAGMNFASGGTKVAVEGMDAGLDALKAADAANDAAKAAESANVAIDAAKAAKGADTAAGASKLTAKLDDPARMQAWESGRLAGRQKADKLAEALKGGDATEIKQALVECQKDKHAIQALNKGDDSLKTAYNQNMKQLITDDVDQVMKEKIAQRYGVDPDDVEIVKPTNPTNKPKIGSDRDFTIKVKAKPGEFVPDPNKHGSFIQVKPGDNLTKDVPIKDAQKIYNRELYSKVTGEPIPTDPKKFEAFQAEADKLAHDMDHVAGHRVGAESYGASQQDLEVILQKSGGRFTDPEQAGKLASFKSNHLYEQAENIAKVNPEKAEQCVADGMRQTTKQYDNLIKTRVEALKDQGVAATVDPRLKEAVNILKKVENEGLSPSRAESLLRTYLDMSKDDVATMLGDQLAKLHMMKAK